MLLFFAAVIMLPLYYASYAQARDTPCRAEGAAVAVTLLVICYAASAHANMLPCHAVVGLSAMLISA